MIKEVCVLSYFESTEITRMINIYLEQGWQMHGELRIIPINDERYFMRFVQMMVK